MSWDSTRPIPWARLCREWLVYVSIMVVVFLGWTAIRGGELKVSTFAGLLASGPMYVAFGAILAKFGYQRKTLRDLKAARPEPRRATTASSDSVARVRPAATSRTSTGPSQHRPKNKRKKR